MDWARPWMRETWRSPAVWRNSSHWPGGRKVEKESAPEVSMVAVAEARLHQSLMPCSTAAWISMPCWAALTLRFCRSRPGSLLTTFSRSLDVAGELMGDTILTSVILYGSDTLVRVTRWSLATA